MNARGLLVLALVMALTAQAAALTVTLDKPTYFIGQEMAVSGACTANSTVEVAGLVGKAQAFSQAAPCSGDGKYSVSQALTFLMPPGSWTVKAAEGEAKAEQAVDVKPVAQSDYYLITFVSPAPVKHSKTEALTVSVKVTESGEPVSGATVVFYDVSGESKPLQESGLGVYSADYQIPFDAPGGNWALHVQADKTTDKEYGGENTLIVGVDHASLKLDLVEPALKNYDLGAEIPFKVKATYANGKGIVDGKAWVELAGQKFDLDKVIGEESTFEGKFKPSESQIGSLTFHLTVQDSAENQGDQSIDLVVTVDRLALFIKDYWLIILVIVVVVAVGGYVSYSKVRGQLDRKSLLAERAKLREAIRKIQSDYFDRMLIDKNTFKKRLGEAEARLLEIDKILKSQGGLEA